MDKGKGGGSAEVESLGTALKKSKKIFSIIIGSSYGMLHKYIILAFFAKHAVAFSNISLKHCTNYSYYKYELMWVFNTLIIQTLFKHHASLTLSLSRQTSL